MKRIFKVVLSVALLTGMSLGFAGCKKGEDDPAISLRSRDARITGEWRLTKMETSNIYEESGFNRNQIMSFDGTTMTETIIINGNTTIESYTYSLNLNLEKNGRSISTSIQDGVISTSSSNWVWMNSAKNKTSIAIGHLDGILQILELRNNKMVIIGDRSMETENHKSIFKAVYTFEKK